MRRMNMRALAPDVLAGVSIAGLLVPEAVAYSGLAGLPPQAGVIALLAGLLAYGLLGNSRFAIVSATSSSAAVLASATLALGADTVAERVALAALVVVGTGVAFVLGGALRLGAMSNVIARPVLRGFTLGLALVIAVKQWPSIVAMRTASSGFFSLLVELTRNYAAWHLPSLACGLTALVFLRLLRRLPRVPAMPLVMVASILAAPTLSAHGVALTGPLELTFALPNFVLPPGVRWVAVAEYSLALMLILYAESYSSIRSCALRHDEEVRPNRDLWALGIANLLAGSLRGAAVGAGYSGTAANEAAGAQSRAAGLAAAAIVLVVVVVLRHWIEQIPQPVLAAIVIHAVARSVRLDAFRNYLRWQRDLAVALAAVLGVMVFGVLNGLLAAIAFSIVLLLRSLAQPHLSVLGRVGDHDYVSVERHPAAVTVPHMLVLRPEEPLFFGNVEPLLTEVRAQVLAAPQAKLVVLSLEESPDLDGTALEALGEFCSWLAARGRQLRLARLKDRAREALLRARLTLLPDDALDYWSVDDAVRGVRVSADRG
jgi:sulfate permease, SulP family